jgi:hypothetical protein
MRRLHATMAVAVLLAIIPLGAPRGATAQAGPETAIDERTFGTSASVVQNIPAFAFTGVSGADNAAVEVNASLRRCTSDCGLVSSVFLPAGARVSRIELAACDHTSSGEVRALLTRVTGVEGGGLVIGFVNTGVAAAPGCNFFAADLSAPETIDNFNNNYHVGVSLSGTPTAQLQAVRLYYTLQVSPAPATATFDDVSTGHPFFAFIEALSAAGITAGCSASPPLYCPDAPLTRGQMAVFLSRALGLHWAP